MLEIKGKTVLVTGATGYIGSHVSRRLLLEGARIKAFVRNVKKASDLKESGAEIVCGDITDPLCIRQAVKGCQLVFHFAGVLGDEYRSWDYFRKVNVDGTRFLVEAALSEKVERFIYTSTAWVYGLDAGKNTNEKAPLHFSKDPYCDTKVEAELLVRESFKKNHLPCVIVQPTQVYGPDDETWTLGPIKMIQSNTMMFPGGGKGLVQPIFIDDVVEGIMAAAKRGTIGESYLLCGKEVLEIREFFGYYARIVGKKWIPSVPRWLGAASSVLLEGIAGLTRTQPLFTKGAVRGTLMSATYNCEKARGELGVDQKITISEGMKRVGQWFSLYSNKGK
jgi:nucleoside-diphosphate-sugar epimerase